MSREGRPSPLLLGVAFGGYVFTANILLLAMRAPVFTFGGDVTRIYNPVGDAFRAGAPIYAGGPSVDPFFYAPPWALLFGLLSWLPIPVQYALVIAADFAGLRYMARSWTRAGLLCWLPLVPLTLNTGNINLLLGAAIYAGARGGTVLPTALGLAKLSPFITISPRNWRRSAVVVGLLFAPTLPWASLWLDWLEQLARYAGQSIGPQIPVPFVVRLPVAVAILFGRRPWTTALAGVVAIPAFYWESFVCLLAPLCLWLEQRSAARSLRPGATN
jgi:hypothetical protein